MDRFGYEFAAMPGYSLLGTSSGGYLQMLAAGEGRLPSQTQASNEHPLVLMPFGWRGAVGNGQLSPVMSKLYQESGLRDLANSAVVNPETANACGLLNGDHVRIRTSLGSIETEIHFDPAVMPGVVHVAVGPARNGSGNDGKIIENILAICNLDHDATWRVTPAQIEPA
jgi:anaerobic selenocysteine-containing dehydrogenase